jgi:hypothetical protein
LGNQHLDVAPPYPKGAPDRRNPRGRTRRFASARSLGRLGRPCLRTISTAESAPTRNRGIIVPRSVPRDGGDDRLDGPTRFQAGPSPARQTNASTTHTLGPARTRPRPAATVQSDSNGRATGRSPRRSKRRLGIVQRLVPRDDRLTNPRRVTPRRTTPPRRTRSGRPGFVPPGST